MLRLLTIFTCVLCLGVLNAQAQDLMPPTSSLENLVTTHPDLKLTPDKSELVRLDQDAMTVIVGNPAHLNVMLDTPRLMVLVPRAPGATHFTVLDRDGNVIMQRHALVAAPKRQYVRIRRSCASGAEGCQPTSVFYCPDSCHEVQVRDDGDTGLTSLPETPANAPASSEEVIEDDQP